MRALRRCGRRRGSRLHPCASLLQRPQARGLCGESRMVSFGCQQFSFELFVKPIGKCGELFVAAKEIADHLSAGLRSALLEYGFAVTRASFATKQVCGVELRE